MKKRGYYYLRNGSYHCFNCDANCSGMKLLEILSGDDYATLHSEYVRKIYDGRHFGSVSSSAFARDEHGSVLSEIKNVIKPKWKHPLSDRAKEYLNGRLVLSAPFLKEELFSYYTKKGEEYILIPWKINGTDCYFQLNDFERHNNGGLKYIFPKNMDKMIYGLDNVSMDLENIIVMEGVYDTLFVPNAVCIGGKFLTDLQLDILRKRYPRHRICLSFDNDLPGLKAMAKSLEDKRYNFSYFRWFDDGTKEKDINDFIKRTGNPNEFSDRKFVETHVIDSVMMKMWLLGKGLGK
jgi:DNA primase